MKIVNASIDADNNVIVLETDAGTRYMRPVHLPINEVFQRFSQLVGISTEQAIAYIESVCDQLKTEDTTSSNLGDLVPDVMPAGKIYIVPTFDEPSETHIKEDNPIVIPKVRMGSTLEPEVQGNPWPHTDWTGVRQQEDNGVAQTNDITSYEDWERALVQYPGHELFSDLVTGNIIARDHETHDLIGVWSTRSDCGWANPSSEMPVIECVKVDYGSPTYMPHSVWRSLFGEKIITIFKSGSSVIEEVQGNNFVATYHGSTHSGMLNIDRW